MGKDINLYIGEKELKGLEGTTATFMDGSQETFTEKQLEYVITKEPKDRTAFRELEINAIAIAVLEVFEEYDVKKGLVQTIVERLVGGYNDTFAIAVGKAFGTFKEGVHPEDMMGNIKISDIKRLKDG